MIPLGMAFRRPAFAALTVAGLLAGAGVAGAQTLRMEEIEVKVDGSINVQKVLATFPFDLQGYSLSMSYDPALYEVVGLDWAGTAVDDVFAPGASPAFWSEHKDPVAGEIVIGCVLAFGPAPVISPADPAPKSLLIVRYKIRAAAGPFGSEVPSMYFEGGHPSYPGGPGIFNVLTTDGMSVDPEQQEEPLMLHVFGAAWAPAAPVNLSQVVGAVVPAQELTAWEAIVTFKMKASDPDSALLRYDIEAREVGVAFTGTPTQPGTTTFPVGQLATVPYPTPFKVGAYHWQARAIDPSNAASPWVAAGGNSEDEADFVISSPVVPPHPGTEGPGEKQCAQAAAGGTSRAGIALTFLVLAALRRLSHR